MTVAEKCKHGLDPRFCGPCRRENETVPLTIGALRVTNEGVPALLLRERESSRAVALLLDGEAGQLVTVDMASLRSPESADTLALPPLLQRFRSAALVLGHLMQPPGPLTAREQGEEGPPHCRECKVELSFATGSLGCTECESYVCRCGRCLCGFTGRNYLGQAFSQPPLPILREERLEYVRVVRLSERGA